MVLPHNLQIFKYIFPCCIVQYIEIGDQLVDHRFHVLVGLASSFMVMPFSSNKFFRFFPYSILLNTVLSSFVQYNTDIKGT